MPSTSRRKVLASLASTVGLAGCSARKPTPASSEPVDTATPSRTPAATASTDGEATPGSTESPTPDRSRSPLAGGSVAFLVVVMRQPDDHAPGRIRASLTNETGESLILGGGDPVPVGYDTIEAEQVDASTPLMLFPQQSDATNEYMNAETSDLVTVEDAVRQECWRMPTHIVHTLEAMNVELPPDASVVADYFPLGYPDADCPAGTYEAHGDMSARATDGKLAGRIRTTLLIQVSRSGSLSVDGSMRVESR